jgi:integrase/recombinase XerD
MDDHVVLSNHQPLSLHQLIEFDAMCGRAENKSEKTIELTTLALRLLERFLDESGLSTRAEDIGPPQMRAFILDLQQSPRFKNHPYITKQGGVRSSAAVNAYLRAIRAAWNRWRAERLVEHSPFDVVRLPRFTNKVIPALSPAQVEAFLRAIDTRAPQGYRDYALILFSLDTTCRLSEATELEMPEVDIRAGRAKVTGKGRRERYAIFGLTVRKVLWKYVNKYRPEPRSPSCDNLFLTHDGRPLTKNRVEAIVKKYARKAGITGVRVSPHTLRHTACLMWTTDDGDIISLQKLTGHSSINTLRGYVNLNTDQLQAAHRRHSPVDNLRLPVR